MEEEKRKPGRPKKRDRGVFLGFTPEYVHGDYFRMPAIWIDVCANIDNLAELKCVQYVLRHTWGYREFDLMKHITIDEFVYGRKTAQGWEVCSAQVVAMFQVETKPEDTHAEGQGNYRLCLLENGKMQMAESLLRLPPLPKPGTAVTSGPLTDQGWGEIASGDEESHVTSEYPAWSSGDEEIEEDEEPVQFTLREWRIKANLSRTELADMAGVSYADMTRAEIANYRPIDRAIAEKILTALRARFEAYPQYAKWEKVPERVEEIEGLLVKEEASNS